MMKTQNLITILTLSFLISCNHQPLLSTEVATPFSYQSPYPAFQKTPMSYPFSNTLIFENTPTVDYSLGIIKGVLLENNKPLQNSILYLADVLTDQNGQDIAFSFDRVSSLRTATDSSGAFKFINVKPGNYGIVLDLIIDSYLLLNPSSSEQMKITVTPGKEVDLGVLNYSELPTEP